jgi:CheY-like chemotaxis protein
VPEPGRAAVSVHGRVQSRRCARPRARRPRSADRAVLSTPVVREPGGGLDASIAALWERARERALGRVDAVEEAVVALLSGPVEAGLAERARREAHKLAGSLGTFGMPAGTEHARALELRVEAGARPADAPGLADHVTVLRRIVEAGPAETVAPEPPPGPRDVAVMGLPGPRETEVLRALADRGVAAVAASEPGAAPVALVCGADLAARVERLAVRGDRVAVIVPAGETDHVELVRRGALRLLPESLSSDAIADELLSLVAGGRRTEDRVLVVDDDRGVLARARDVLAAAGYGVATLDDPAGFWPALDRNRPDLVVLDVDLPGANGIELCRALRADAHLAAVRVGRQQDRPGPVVEDLDVDLPTRSPAARRGRTR